MCHNGPVENAAETTEKGGRDMAEERNAEKQPKKTARSKAPPKKKTRYHWGKIRTEYVTGEKSYRELAKKHGVSMSQLSEVASKEGWAKLRAEHRAETAAKAEQKLKEQQAGALADELEGIRRTARNLSAAIEKKSLGKRLDSKSLRELVSATKDLAAILRDVFDQPNLLNQAKLDKETGKGPETVEVVLDEEAEELSE
nr:MAG TPA: Protein of unknown function (DUF1804) [Caudoviricetes sp.]